MLDLVYVRKGRTYDCELKTSREVGLDLTAQQITEFVKWCDPLILLVPRGSIEEAHTILTMINLDHRVIIEAYDAGEDEE